jgi:hypothetical protein
MTDGFVMHLIINSECNSIPQGVKFRDSQGSALLNLLSCLGYNPVNPPLADLLRRAYRFDEVLDVSAKLNDVGEHWLVLTPIHWQATHNDALITALGKDLALQEVDAQFWFNLFAEYLTSEEMTLFYHNAQTWLLYAPNSPPLKAKPPHQLLSQSLMPELAQLDQTLFWQKFITESQMLLASKPNQTLMNGLWPWGNALLSKKKITAICVDEAFLPIAHQIASQVSVYHSNLRLKEQDIILITEFSKLSESHQEELKKLPVHWYWNNVAYNSNVDSWFIYLWRKLIHAY